MAAAESESRDRRRHRSLTRTPRGCGSPRGPLTPADTPLPDECWPGVDAAQIRSSVTPAGFGLRRCVMPIARDTVSSWVGSRVKLSSATPTSMGTRTSESVAVDPSRRAIESVIIRSRFATAAVVLGCTISRIAVDVTSGNSRASDSVGRTPVARVVGPAEDVTVSRAAAVMSSRWRGLGSCRDRVSTHRQLRACGQATSWVEIRCRRGCCGIRRRWGSSRSGRRSPRSVRRGAARWRGSWRAGLHGRRFGLQRIVGARH